MLMKPVISAGLISLLARKKRLFTLVEHQAVMWEVVGSNPGQINTQGLKIIEEKVLPL